MINNTVIDELSIDFGKAVAVSVYTVTQSNVQLNRVKFSIDGDGTCEYDNNLVDIHARILLSDDCVTEIILTSNEIDVLSGDGLRISGDVKLTYAYSEYVKAHYINDIFKSDITIEAMRRHSLRWKHGEHYDKIRKLIDDANDSVDTVAEWYKIKAIDANIESVNSFILVKPGYDSTFTAHVLPKRWYNEAVVPSVILTKVHPHLLEAWYLVESKRRECVFNVCSSKTVEALGGITKNNQ